jgi:hypothetical protein
MGTAVGNLVTDDGRTAATKPLNEGGIRIYWLGSGSYRRVAPTMIFAH